MDDVSLELNNRALKSALSMVGYRNASIGRVDGEKIYTNEQIKLSFLEIIKSQSTLSPIKDHIIKLIDTDRIVPVHVSEGILRKIKKLFTKSKQQHARVKHAMAFFDFQTRKIFILVENIKNVKYHKNDESISLVLLHELQHYTSISFSNSFIKVHNKSLIKYYKRFFKLYFHVDVSDKDLQMLFKWLHFKSETIRGRSSKWTNLLIEYGKILKNILKKHIQSEDKLKDLILQYLMTIKLYFISPEMYIQGVFGKKREPYSLYLALAKSYKALNIANHNTLCIQETVFPSEVICIESEYNTQTKHFMLVSKIR